MEPTSIPPSNATAAAPQNTTAPATPELPKQPEKLLEPPHRSSVGAVIGIVIILVVLIVGALYFWGAQLEKQERSESTNAEEPALSDFDMGLDGFEEISE